MDRLVLFLVFLLILVLIDAALHVAEVVAHRVQGLLHLPESGPGPVVVQLPAELQKKIPVRTLYLDLHKFPLFCQKYTKFASFSRLHAGWVLEFDDSMSRPGFLSKSIRRTWKFWQKAENSRRSLQGKHPPSSDGGRFHSVTHFRLTNVYLSVILFP